MYWSHTAPSLVREKKNREIAGEGLLVREREGEREGGKRGEKRKHGERERDRQGCGINPA